MGSTLNNRKRKNMSNGNNKSQIDGLEAVATLSLALHRVEGKIEAIGTGTNRALNEVYQTLQYLGNFMEKVKEHLPELKKQIDEELKEATKKKDEILKPELKIVPPATEGVAEGAA